ncbi:MAG TPA: aminoglycoside 6-adenylyltransferase [Thermomicrobiales bacterium]|nr:aminoglycoside 6-adenylyltransferase [Thermomicrobiales bacterium]
MSTGADTHGDCIADDDGAITHLRAWGEARDDIRAMLLTSTRALPGGKVDALSDYDVIVVTRDIGPYVTDRRWIDDFGEVLVAYWNPVEAEPATGIMTSGNVVQYEGALKIDFSLWPVTMLDALTSVPTLPVELDAGYRVLLDKDRLATRLAPPSWRGYVPELPDGTTYMTLINDFFIGVPYVAKCLVRGDVLPAKWCLDFDMRYVYLLPMLEWRMECDHDWASRVGINGKGLLERLPVSYRMEMETTYAGLDVTANRQALFRMIALFRRAGREVGEALGYAYPEELDRRVMEHARRMLAGEFGGG